MKRISLFILLLVITSLTSFSQQLPLNSCGIVNLYDASGNRTKRIYFCNNGNDPYPSNAAKALSLESETELLEEFQPIDALYPNPTTGKFYVTFNKALKAANVLITDVNGRVIKSGKESGYKICFDLSSVPAGVYFIRINDGKNSISKKVIKR